MSSHLIPLLSPRNPLLMACKAQKAGSALMVSTATMQNSLGRRRRRLQHGLAALLRMRMLAEAALPKPEASHCMEARTRLQEEVFLLRGGISMHSDSLVRGSREKQIWLEWLDESQY